jgi:hypothetical protein
VVVPLPNSSEVIFTEALGFARRVSYFRQFVLMGGVDIPSKPPSQAESAILRFLAKLELD